MHEGELCGARFVELLEHLTVSNEIPIPINQNRVLKHFLQGEFFSHALCRPWLNTGFWVSEQHELCVTLHHVENGVAQIGMPNGRWLLLSSFDVQKILMRPMHENTPEERIFRFHYQTMRLFSKLCAGRNRAVTDYLLTNAEIFGVKYNDLLHMLGDASLSHCYR